MVCKYFEQITNKNKQMIFGCYCNKLQKSIYAFNCNECELKEEEKNGKKNGK